MRKKKVGNTSESLLTRKRLLNATTVCMFVRSVNKLHLHMKPGTQSHTNTHTCPRCNTQMPSNPLVDINQSDVLDCPDCGQEKLKVSFYIDWD